MRSVDGTLAGRQPARVVVGRRLPPLGARVLDDAAPTLHLRTHDPRAVLDRLCADGVHRVLLEGGPTLTAAFLRAGLVDEVVAYVAPVLLGAGRSAVADLGIASIDAALRLEPVDVTALGPDVRVTARPVTPPLREEHP
ncbi:Riboflavin biosynthesis protein ribD (Includes: Diaminohydroxyphosphoribosylaminopyrimidine deaminase; 5-amino-6-(5-phosphoribosylamino)uracil reductase) (fragment) [Nostocoides japonicum T1-X7]|uniref:Riboflavin biosynthesis protein ribD n=1 Tax=Nostocoides japonicum T1-X7 TaxID=1194083 RepID=A0A077M5B8_9MICO